MIKELNFEKKDNGLEAIVSFGKFTIDTLTHTPDPALKDEVVNYYSLRFNRKFLEFFDTPEETIQAAQEHYDSMVYNQLDSTESVLVSIRKGSKPNDLIWKISIFHSTEGEDPQYLFLSYSEMLDLKDALVKHFSRENKDIDRGFKEIQDATDIIL